MRQILPGIVMSFFGLIACAACTENTEVTTNSSVSEVVSVTGQTAEPDVSPEKLNELAAYVAMEKGVRDIKRLQRAYAQYLGEGRWQDAAALFSDGGVLIDGREMVRGKNDIVSHFTERYGPAGLADGLLNEHLILSPVINIKADGASAEGRWRLVSLQGEYGKEARWEGGIYENSYIFEGGVWKIAELHFYPIYGGEYQAGWRMLNEEVQEEVQPVPYHYTADEAGIPVPQLSNYPETEQTLPDLDFQAARLLDEDAIIRLQNAYGYYMDRMLWDDLAELFHDNGSLELGHMGVYQGRQNIRTALEQFGEQGLAPTRIFDHLQLQPVVTVEGDRARARGTELKMLGEFEGEQQWGIAIYDNTFIREGDTWHLDAVHVYDRMLTDYDQGWAASALPARQASEAYPADLEPTVSYPVYPQRFEPELSFPHPVLDMADIEPAGTDRSVTVDELERKLRVLNAWDGAENVSNAYGYYIDEFEWDGMADVFAVNGWKELSYIGSYVGRERVRSSVVDRYGRGGRRANSMTYHQKVQPVVTVAEDGYSAGIRTRLFQLNSSFANPGSYISGIYENRIVIEDGIWRIEGMDLDYAWTANVDGGWANVAPGSSSRFAPAPGSMGDDGPDRPLRGVVVAPYPADQVDMAFHYLNPVSGRQPEIYLKEWNYEAMEFPVE